MLDHPLIGLAVALMPLPIAYLLGWRLLRHGDDPTFAEEWFRHRTAMAKLAVGAWVVACVLAERWTAAWVVIAIADHVVMVVQWTAHGSQILFYSTGGGVCGVVSG